MGRAGSHPALEGNGLTLNVDMAGSLLYLSMVWNLDEWLSSWYSSECLLRVCITFWKGRKEGTAKMNQRETEKKKKKKQKGRGASIWAGRGTGMGKRLRDCSDTSHERGVREGRRQIDRLLAHAHTSSTSFSLLEFGNWECCRGVPLSENLVKMTDRNAIVADCCLHWPFNSGFCLTH